MIYKVAFTLCVLMYNIVLYMVYFSKQEFKGIRNRVYSMLIINTITICASEILYVIFLGNNMEFVASIFYKVYLFSTVIWTCFSMLYIYSIFEKKSLKTNTYKEIIIKNKIYLIIFSVVSLILIILENAKLNKNNLVFFQDNIFCIILLVIMAIIYLVFLYSSTNNHELTKAEKKSINFTSVILLITIFLQLLFTEVSLMPAGYVIVVYVLFFLYENPDVEILEELGSANVTIDKSLQTKADFLSNMTYEISTPINVINNLVNEIDGMEQYNVSLLFDDVKRMISYGNDLLDNVNNVLDISKIESGNETIQERDYRILDVVNNIVNIFQKKINKNDVKLIANVNPNISTVLRGDLSRINQILFNIMSNATKYTKVGKIILSVSSVKQNDREILTFKITDTGSGIKAEDRDKVFVREEAKDNIGSNGLGLVITKEYVDLLGGKIWFNSRNLVGTTFFIELTQKIVDPTPISFTMKNNKANISKARKDCSKYTALIVDDNELNIKLTRKLLSDYRFNIESVNDGNECVYRIKEGKHYDIIFLDHVMPDMDGIETMHVLRKLCGDKTPPTIMLTANAIIGMRDVYMKEGFDDYLPKPINPNELNRIINQFLK